MPNAVRTDLDVIIAPYIATQDWDDAVRTTLPTLARWEKEVGRRLVIVQNQMSQFGGVLDDLAKVATVMSPRSKRPATHGPALAYVPTADAIQLAQRVAVGGLAVVALHEKWVDGWARAFGALNLATGEQYPAFSDHEAEALDRVSWYGNNGWPPRDSFIRGPVGSALGDLFASGLTLADVEGAMYARGHRLDSVARLAKFV